MPWFHAAVCVNILGETAGIWGLKCRIFSQGIIDKKNTKLQSEDNNVFIFFKKRFGL